MPEDSSPIEAAADNYRAQFDIEIEFSNGGGVQGQAFRIDIDGDGISDEEIAVAIVQDLGLLMVKDVRIQNKTIVRERHKRRAVAATGPSSGNGSKRIDLSHVVEDGMITYKGMLAPIVCDFLSREDSRSHYAEGTEFQIGRIDMWCEHRDLRRQSLPPLRRRRRPRRLASRASCGSRGDHDQRCGFTRAGDRPLRVSAP